MIWAHLIFRHVTFSMPHWGILPILIEIYRSPLVYMIIHGYEIHARLMFDFILFWYSEEPLLSHSARFFDIVVIPRGNYFRCLDFPRHHFRGVHIRSITRPIGVILGSSGQIGYIWCHTRAYCLHFSPGGDRSLTYPLQFPSLDWDILYSPHWPLFLSSQRSVVRDS